MTPKLGLISATEPKIDQTFKLDAIACEMEFYATDF